MVKKKTKRGPTGEKHHERTEMADSTEERGTRPQKGKKTPSLFSQEGKVPEKPGPTGGTYRYPAASPSSKGLEFRSNTRTIEKGSPLEKDNPLEKKSGRSSRKKKEKEPVPSLTGGETRGRGLF